MRNIARVNYLRSDVRRGRGVLPERRQKDDFCFDRDTSGGQLNNSEFQLQFRVTTWNDKKGQLKMISDTGVTFFLSLF